MEAKQPTQEQIKEFWEWCGFTEDRMGVTRCPNGAMLIGSLPVVDLNNLFRRAMPKLHAYCLQSFNEGHKKHHATVVPYPYTSLQDMKTYGATVSRKEDPALALFWAIWEVIYK